MALNPPVSRSNLITNGTTTGSTNGVMAQSGVRTYSASAVASSGTGNAVVQVQGSIDGVNYDQTPLGTISLTSASTAGMSDGFSSNDRYFYVRGNITSLSSNVTVNLRMGQ